MSTQKIGLGSAQWGLNYGISNIHGQAKSAEIAGILQLAQKYGIKTIDTAALYGQAEEVLGQESLDGFDVITKTPHYRKSRITESDASDLDGTFKESLKKLQIDRASGLLLHNSDDLLLPGWEHLAQKLFALKDCGLTQRIGLSLYSSQNIELMYERLRPDIVQLPISVLDQRLIKDGTVEWLHTLGVEIHVRSVFLQGLLLMPLETLSDYFSPWKKEISRWHVACQEQGMTPLQAAINFVSSINEVDRIIIGFESERQFLEVLSAGRGLEKFDATTLSCTDPGLLNPSSWIL